MKYYLIVGEASGDLLASHLITSIVSRDRDAEFRFFGWIYFTITFVLAAVAISFFYPLVSIILIVVGLLIVFMQFGLYKKFIDRFFPEKTGHNVTAVKSCKGEVKRRIFFNGHPDAAWEWPVNYKLGGVGFEGHAVICGIGAVYYLVISIMLVKERT